MSMTMTQKILAKHAGLESVVAGQLIEAKLDMVLGNDVTSPVAINEMTKFGKNSVFDKTKISLVMDHLLKSMILLIIMMSEIWVSNMHFCLNRV